MNAIFTAAAPGAEEARNTAVLAGVVLGVIFIPPLLRFFGKVARIRRVSRLSALPVLEPMAFEQLPADVQGILAQPAPALAAWAFHVAAYARMDSASGSRTCFALWVRPATGDMAVVAVADPPNRKPANGVRDAVVSFETRLADGTRIMTYGGLTLLRQSGATERLLLCPEIRNTNHLYDVHRNWVSANVATDRLGVLPPAGEELASEQRSILAERQRLISLGYYRLITDDTLKLTWKGAWLIARRMRPAAKIASHRQTSKKLRSLGFWDDGSPRMQVRAFEVVQTARCPVGRPPMRVEPLDDSGQHADQPES